jgi:hypothetical protein
MKKEGIILKMSSEYEPDLSNNNKAVSYTLPIGQSVICMNKLIGRDIHFRYLKKIHCIHCGRITTKSYAQGYCYPCFISLPETDECILKPELCQAHLGISRDMEWSKKHCLQDHFVYFALTSGLKVGVTRSSQVPERWIDQGALMAIKLAKTPNRYLAGIIEVALKQYFADKTNWRNMLTDKIDKTINLIVAKERAVQLLSEDEKIYVIDDNKIFEIHYPVYKYPDKVKSISFDKTDDFTGILTGIKGQYLLFENDFVLNIRRHNGYLVCIEY